MTLPQILYLMYRKLIRKKCVFQNRVCYNFYFYYLKLEYDRSILPILEKHKQYLVIVVTHISALVLQLVTWKKIKYHLTHDEFQIIHDIFF
jgi:uncharacterized membrane protein YdbT with pleckstrin-like domain